MKKKSIAWALVLILLAVYLIVSRMGFAPALPFFTLVFTLLFFYTALKGFIRLHFFEGFLSLAILGCIHDEFLGITAITPWTLLLAGVLLGIAFDMIFKGIRKNKRDDEAFTYTCHSGGEGYEARVENVQDSEHVHVKNSFGALCKYVNSESFSSAQVENSFGECKVYFNNALLAGGTARLRVHNSFGATRIYLPGTWRAVIRKDCMFGNVSFQGRSADGEGAPVIELALECSFGEITVIFE
ncbi:MAG: LiaF-related protein [Blautia sp.]|nr:LiaF-related protein [Blautia sp.]